VIVSVRKEVWREKLVEEQEKLLRDLVTVAVDMQNSSPLSRLCSSEALGSIVNKLPEENLNTFVKDVLRELVLGSSNQSHFIQPLSWLGKGLVTRGHSSSKEIAEVFQTLLSAKQYETANAAAAAFHTLLHDSALLSKHTHAIINPLYKQKFFTFVLPSLLNSYQTATDRGVFIVALSHLLHNIPKPVLLSEFQNVLPLLISSLTYELKPENRNKEEIHKVTSVKLITLNVLQLIFSEIPHTLTLHISTLIPFLLSLITWTDSMDVRISALSCLTEIGKRFEYHVIFPMRTEVINKVVFALDDPKRLVRNQAVKCSNTWHHLSKKTS